MANQIKGNTMSETLNREQVLTKAKDLGIVHDKRARTDAVLKLINELTGEDNKAEVKKPIKTEGFTRCMIHSNDRDNDEVEMTLGLNGEMLQIQIGEEIELPNRFIPVLKDAVIIRHVSVLDSDGNPTGKKKVRKEPRYILESV